MPQKRETFFAVTEVRVGKLAPLGATEVLSGIDKKIVLGPVTARATGLDGDEQGDRRHHGGPDKAIHVYPLSHYTRWAAELPDQAELFRPGGFGENFVVDGVTEADVCLGDRFRLGDALLELSQSRQSCWRLNIRFGRADMARLVQTTGRTGWYFRVLEPGEITAGGPATLEARPHPEWTLQRIARLLYHDTQNETELAEFAALPDLPERWRRLAKRRLSTRGTEDWTSRIVTPEGVAP